VINPIECLADINGDHNSPGRRFRIVETFFYPGGDGEKSRGARTERDEAMLSWRRRKRSGEKRKNKPLKNFSSRGKQRDGAVGGAKVRGFSWFEDRNNICGLPDRVEVSLVEGVVKEGGKIGDTPRTHVLEMKGCETIRAHS
jgi:hypothetical protein